MNPHRLSHKTEPHDRSHPGQRGLSRREFISRAGMLASAAWLGPALTLGADGKRTATDLVPLGNTGLRISRLGFGTGSNAGSVQRALGQAEFNRLIRYAYDQGITYIDTSQSYRTFEWMGDAIKGLPREKLFIQSKIPGTPEKPMEVIDRHRKMLNTDYLDSLLVHCATTPRWDDERKRVLDAFQEAQERKIILAKGVSCHSLPALHRATELDWANVHLVRVNPQGAHIDTSSERWDATSNASHLPPVLDELRAMKAKGRGTIGMKIIGNGDFTAPEDREKSIRFVMALKEIDAIVIGFKSTAEIDEALERMNRALAA